MNIYSKFKPNESENKFALIYFFTSFNEFLLVVSILIILSILPKSGLADSTWIGVCSNNWNDNNNCGSVSLPKYNWGTPTGLPTATTPNVTVSTSLANPNGWAPITISEPGMFGGQTLTIENNRLTLTGTGTLVTQTLNLNGGVVGIFPAPPVQPPLRGTIIQDMGTDTISDSLIISRNGFYRLNDGILTANNIQNLGGLWISGGVVHASSIVNNHGIDSIGNLSSFIQEGGIISGTNDEILTLTNNDLFTFTSGIINGNIINNGQINAGNDEIINANTIQNSGTLFIGGGDIHASSIANGSGAVITQEGGNISGANSETLTFTNNGLFNYSSGSFDGDLINNGITTFNPFIRPLIPVEADVKIPSNETFGGNISGSGSLVKEGDGTLILTGKNSNTGNWRVSGGVLQGNTDSLQGNITNNASVVFDQATAGTYASAMSGTGSLIKENGGSLVLSGLNSYSGGTNLDGGTLSVGSDSNLGDPSGALNFNGGILQVTGTSFHSMSRPINLGAAGGGLDIANLNNVFTMDKPLSGPGSLNKMGPGMLVLNGNNNYSGDTTVSAGNLQVGDASHPEASILGQVMIDPTGILSGHGTINGNVNNAGSISPGGSIGTLTVKGDVNFTPGSTFNVEIDPFQSSLLNVSGLASLGYANVSVLADPGYYSPQSYTILSAGSITGQFGNVDITNAAANASLNLLTPSLQYFPNRVVLNLDAASDPAGPLTKVTDTFFKTTLRTVGGRLNAPLGVNCPENTFGFWARGLGMLSSADASGSAPGYDGGTAGAVMGFDRQFGEHLSLGIAGFTAHSDVSTYQRVTNNSYSDSAGVSLYGAYTPGAWQFKTVLGYDNDTYHAQRTVGNGALSRQANSKTYNNHVNNYSEISYSFKSRNLTLQPLVGLQLGWMHQNGFTETGGGPGQNLSVDGRTLYTLDTLAGLRTRKELDLNENFKAQIEVRAIYDHDFGTLQNSVSGQFSNGQRGMLQTADRPGQRDSGIVGASFALLTTNSLNFYLDYNGEFWSAQQAHFISAGVRYSW